MIEQALLSIIIHLFVGLIVMTIIAVALIIAIVKLCANKKQPHLCIAIEMRLKLNPFGNHILWFLIF